MAAPRAVEIVEEEGIPPDPSPPTRAVSICGGGKDNGRKTKGTISASLGAMVPLVGNLDYMILAPQGRSSKRVRDAIRLLKADVEELSSYLDELSEVEDPSPTAMCWMNEARDLSYDMEDYIGNLYEQLEDVKTTRAVRRLTTHVKTPKSLVRTISEFRMYVQEAIQRREVYGLSGSVPSSVSTLRRRFVSVDPMLPKPYEETAEIVIDGRMNEFITSLVKDGDQKLKVVSVFGSACLGKTTLARVLYNTIGKQYNCRAFIRVSRKPDMKSIFRDMLWQLQGQHPQKDCKEIDLIDNINKYLQDKRYLIIIDDVWTASVWNIINHAFPKGSHGSRIITTTQMEDVALTCCRYESEHVFEMKPLDEDHSRKLFFNRIFGSESQCPQQLQAILTEIVEICGGLPLATISIASLLASQHVITIELLTYIYQSLSSCFLTNYSTLERTRQALNLSFNNLPQYLRTCLLYLSMRREGYIFSKDDLVKQWMAEGFIDTTEGQDAEEVATSYLHQLIGRRFIQPISIKYNNEVGSCEVHDAVHDVIAHKSAERNFIFAIDCSQMNVALSPKVRRLSLLFDDARYGKTPANIIKQQIRSLTFFGLLECMPCITEFKLLSVLNLQLSDHGDNDPVDLAAISELFQLRYLKIASDVCIKLPKHGLECLETLDIMDARVAMDGGVPCVPYIHLPHLLHLSLSDELNLLHWINNLVSDGKLNYLQDLHITTSSTSDFYHLQFLRLIITSSHHDLKTVVVSHGSSVQNGLVPGAYEVTNSWKGVKLPPRLQRFEFVRHNRIVLSRIPPSVRKHENLRILKIEVRDLEMSSVHILRGLPALTALSLYVKFAPFQFSVLKYFKLRFTSGIAWLKFEADAMPSLWKLKLVFDAIPRMDKKLVLFSNCPPFEPHKLGTAVISIEHMPGLKDISVKFGGAAADVEYALRVGVSNHPSNPTINKQPVDYSCYADERSKLKQQPAEILVEGQDEYDQKQPDENYKQLPDKILKEEPDEYYKHQPDDILEVEPNDYYKHQTDENLDEEPYEYYKQRADENLDEEPGEYCKQQPYDNLDEEPGESYKQQPYDNLDEEPGEYKKILKRSADASISSSPESSRRPHFSEKTPNLLSRRRSQATAVKWRPGCFGWDQKEEPSNPRKEKPRQNISERRALIRRIQKIEAQQRKDRERKDQERKDQGRKNRERKDRERKDMERQAQEDRTDWLKRNDPIEEQSSSLANMSVHAFTMDELMSATRNFSTANVLGFSDRANILRNRGFGCPGVYKGSVNGLTPRQVVVIDLGLSYDKALNWLGEAVYLETKKHPNLVKLVGFCDENPHKLLVYEYIPRGSLQYYLVNNLLGRLSLLKRLKIAIGAAKGLTFLNEAGTPMNYSRDFKASKIMLDSDCTAKLWGFVLLPTKGRFGYSGQDQYYNLGVVLLELLTGRPSIDKQGLGCGALFVSEMLPHLESMDEVFIEKKIMDELQRIMDPSLKGRYSVRAAWRMAMIARRCCDPSWPNRPRSMREIVEDLENIVAREPTKQATGIGKERGKAKQLDEAKEVDEKIVTAVTLPFHSTAMKSK